MSGSPDSIIIVDPEASFSDNTADLWVQGASHHALTGEYQRGLEIMEADGSQVELKPWSKVGLNGAVSASVWTTDVGIAVKVSLARPPDAPLSTPNVYPVSTAAELEARLGDYEEALARAGLNVSLRRGRVKRLEWYADVGLMAPFVSHAAGFQAIGLHRLSPYEEAWYHRGVRDRRTKGSTVRRRGGSYGVIGAEHQFVIYDKAAHLAYRAATSARRAGMPRWMHELALKVEGQRPGQAPGRGVARIEERHTTYRAVKNQLGVEVGADLVACFAAVQERFVEVVRAQFSAGKDGSSSDDGEKARSRPGDDAALLHAMAEEEKQAARAIDTFVYARYLEMKSAEPDGLEEFREFLRAQGYDERQINRKLEKPMRWMDAGAGISVGDLFDHLVDGVVTSPYVWPPWTGEGTPR